MGRKISDICLKQGQGMRGRAVPPHPGICRVSPPPGYLTKLFNPISKRATLYAFVTQTSKVHDFARDPGNTYCRYLLETLPTPTVLFPPPPKNARVGILRKDFRKFRLVCKWNTTPTGKFPGAAGSLKRWCVPFCSKGLTSSRLFTAMFLIFGT